MTGAPLILAFDTSASHCDAALIRGVDIVAERSEQMAKGQAERLLVLCQEIMRAAGVGPLDFDAIGVGIGPGNFTGVRISVASARGIALGLGVPAVGVSTLEALAFGTPGKCTAVLSAPRDRRIIQDFLDGYSAGQPRDVAVDAVECSGENCIGAEGQPPVYSIAVAIARIAAQRFRENPPRPAPLYLRAPDAAPAKDAGPEILV